MPPNKACYRVGELPKANQLATGILPFFYGLPCQLSLSTNNPPVEGGGFQRHRGIVGILYEGLEYTDRGYSREAPIL